MSNNCCVSDAELLLLTQSYSRVLSSKKMPVIEVLKFLISKGFTPTPDMAKSDLCLAFKSLVESQPDYIRPSILPMDHTPMHHSIMPHLPIQQTSVQQTVPAANNMLAISQNNNMMQYQAYQTPMQQVNIANCFILYL